MNEKETKKAKLQLQTQEQPKPKKRTKAQKEAYARDMNLLWSQIAGKLEKPWFR